LQILTDFNNFCTKLISLRTHPTTNRAQCRTTALIDTNALLLHQTATLVNCVTEGLKFLTRLLEFNPSVRPSVRRLPESKWFTKSKGEVHNWSMEVCRHTQLVVDMTKSSVILRFYIDNVVKLSRFLSRPTGYHESQMGEPQTRNNFWVPEIHFIRPVRRRKSR